ncbi:MAG: antitoxin ParD1/3/4 [Alphaproteobacteria bacterium]|nr:antitoxin ParD1/3/4 [Alphaproteobacteria bacterium]
MPSMNVSLTPELMKIVQSRVESGLYNNASEVIRDAIRQLETNAQLLHELKLAHLRDALSEGVQQIRERDVVRFSLQDIISELNTANSG